MIIALLTAHAQAASVDWLTVSRPARIEAHVEFNNGKLARSAEMVVRRGQGEVELYLRGDFGQGDEAVVLTTGSSGPVKASQAQYRDGRVLVRSVEARAVVDRMQGMGLYVSDLVELLAPDLRGPDWTTSADGVVLSPEGSGKCRNEYRFTEGEVMPSEIRYCEHGAATRTVNILRSGVVSGYALPEQVQFRAGQLLIAPKRVDAVPGDGLAAALGGA